MLLPLFLIYSVFHFPICSSSALNSCEKNHFRICLIKVFIIPKVNLHFTLITDKLKLTGSQLSNVPRVLNSVLPLTKAENHLLEYK